MSKTRPALNHSQRWAAVIGLAITLLAVLSFFIPVEVHRYGEAALPPGTPTRDLVREFNRAGDLTPASRSALQRPYGLGLVGIVGGIALAVGGRRYFRD